MMNKHICAFDLLNWHCQTCSNSPTEDNGFFVLAPQVANMNTGFKPEYFGSLFEIESQHFWFQTRSQLILWALEKYFPDCKSFFEIGCGTGFVLSAVSKTFPKLELYGSDIYTASLPYASSRIKSAVLFQMDATAIPFKNQFDVIGAFDVLEHIKQDELALSEIYKAIKPGGGIILTVPQHQFLWSPIDEQACHERRYQAADLKNKVIKAGFQVLRSTSFVSLLLPLMMWSRHKLKKANSNTNPDQEVQVSPLLNKILKAILLLESSGIKLGLNYPAGGSLLMMARKPL